MEVSVAEKRRSDPWKIIRQEKWWRQRKAFFQEISGGFEMVSKDCKRFQWVSIRRISKAGNFQDVRAM